MELKRLVRSLNRAWAGKGSSSTVGRVELEKGALYF